MKLDQLFAKATTSFELQARTADDVIAELTTMLVNDGVVSDAPAFIQEIKDREAISTTAFGDGLAIPHAQSPVVTEARIVFGRSAKGIEYQSMDGEPVHLFFLIAVPLAKSNLHLQALAALARKLVHEEFREACLNVSSYQELHQLMSQIETKED
jgi:fructose-specific phosphotransferase system IIA component